MEVITSKNPQSLGEKAGKKAAELIIEAIQSKGEANIIMATGASQFETIKQLISEKGIDWSKVTLFHLDEYIGMPMSHLASFRKYITERFLNQVSPLKQAVLINGEEDVEKECERLKKIIHSHPIDVALVGIGENGHLAFNDPPADFDTEEPYIVVDLDLQCRNQQLGEGWFGSLEEVPKQAISMSIKQIMRSKHIIGSIPDERKAEAVKNTLEHSVSNMYPASILKEHSSCILYLDEGSAKLVKQIY